MKVAVLSDVHGNADALAAVLVDIRQQSPDAIINLGDCFSGPLDVVQPDGSRVRAGFYHITRLAEGV